MRLIIDHWKYIFRNLWFVLPFAVMPAIFMALSVDFSGIQQLARSFFTARLDVDFLEIFRAWSFVRVDSILGGIYSFFAFVFLVLCTGLLNSFVEKHMRIGKRTLSGVFSQFWGNFPAALGITFFFTALYELWAVVLSAVLFAVAAIDAKGFACFLFLLCTLLFMAALIFLVSVFYLWLPCMQITGFRPYNAFLYSYRLAVGVRGKLILSLLLSYAPCMALLIGISFAPVFVSTIIAFVMFAIVYLSFCVRMVSLYFETDKLDREDLLRSYREL